MGAASRPLGNGSCGGWTAGLTVFHRLDRGADTRLAGWVSIRHLREAAGLACSVASVSHVKGESRKESWGRGLDPRKRMSRQIRRWSWRNQFNTERDCQSWPEPARPSGEPAWATAAVGTCVLSPVSQVTHSSSPKKPQKGPGDCEGCKNPHHM